MSKRASPQAGPAPTERNLQFLDALCRWAEALVEMRTSMAYGDRDAEGIAALHDDASLAEEDLARLGEEARKAGTPLPFDALATAYELDDVDVRVLRLVLAPALDTSFRRRIARFKDNVLLDFPDVDFCLSILFDSRVERLKARERFLPAGLLVRERLVNLVLPRDASGDSLLAHEVRLPDRLVTFLMGQDFLDRTVAQFASLDRPEVTPESVVMDEEKKAELLTLVRGRLARGVEGHGVTVGIFGPSGTGKSLLAGAIASSFGLPLITVDSMRLAADDPALRDVLETLFLDAKVRRAVLCFDHCEALFSQKNPRLPSVYAQLEKHPGIVVLLSADPKQLDPSLERWVSYQVELDPPDNAGREALWRTHVGEPGEGVDLPALAMTFEFNGGQIRNAVAVAREIASSRGPGAAVTQADLTAGAWAQVRADMEEYSKKRRIKLTLDDLILPDDEMKQVKEVLDAALARTFILTRWGFGKRLTTGRGLCCLFTGDPGTGKTLCAEILAEALHQGLYQISIPRVMSKYIGETEKNIERIFSTARANNSILLFDEADALFSSRVKVETSVDRFSNMEINLLLQEIERFDGIVILTTNLEKNMDKAFERRIQFKIRFPFPDKKHRAKIWQTLIPKECPIDPEIDWELVGESFDLAGGNIKNAILRAAYRAARDTMRIDMDHIVAAAEAECRHAGKVFRGLKREEF